MSRARQQGGEFDEGMASAELLEASDRKIMVVV